jgi:hypothetical protein
MRSVLWAKHCEEAVELLLCELTAAPGMIEPQEDLLSSGRIDGIGPKVMKRAAAKLGPCLRGKSVQTWEAYEFTGNFRGKQHSFHCPGEVNG